MSGTVYVDVSDSTVRFGINVSVTVIMCWVPVLASEG